jgi:hypothetical protein
MQGTCREHSGNMQETFREHSGNIQGTFGLGAPFNGFYGTSTGQQGMPTSMESMCTCGTNAKTVKPKRIMGTERKTGSVQNSDVANMWSLMYTIWCEQVTLYGFQKEWRGKNIPKCKPSFGPPRIIILYAGLLLLSEVADVDR